MTHIYDLANADLKQSSIVTIGVFDGVHRGHQHLIRELVSAARASNQLSVVLTFFPHPDVFLRGLTGRYYLITPEERARYLLELGVNYVITHPFNETTRQIRASDLVDQLLTRLRMSALWVGEDFAMGYKREGDIAFLHKQGDDKGFEVHVTDLVQTENSLRTISSTLIREALEAGRVEKVREWLGRSYSLSGEVVHGKKRGHAIGYPTANIDVWEQQVIPANGIYAGWAYLGTERFMAMSNIGISPTFGNETITVEAYLLDFDRNIYGDVLTITFEKYLRPEIKFDNLDALIKQIGSDVEQGRSYLLELESTPPGKAIF
jgi:riboflavin kinase / FMN adenylyltransferase